jgi:4-hydroxybutyrate dehydrogenase
MSLITYLTTIRFGNGALKEAIADLASLGIERPLVVTDRGVVAVGLLDRLRAVLGSMPVAVFDEVETNPTEAAALQALAVYRASNCDGVIGLGGGSPLDLAKAVALLATHPEPLSQYAFIDGGMAKITDAMAPVVAIPTTAGTGSEVGRASLMNLADGRKVGIVGPQMIPKRAICDPELTLGMPPRLTAATGMDALSHCVETFLSPRFNPPADAIALDGAGRIIRNIERAVADGKDLAAREELMMGALMGGMCFQKGLGAIHGLSHALGSLKEPSLHHGTLNAVLLPPVLRFNEGHAGDKYARLARSMDLPEDTDLARFFEDLNARIGMPADLASMGVTHEVVDQIAGKAERDHSTGTNPRKVTAVEYAEILRQMIG